MQGAQGLHNQASGNMDLYMEHPKRKQSYSEPVQRAIVSPCILFNSYWHSCMICVQWLIHEFKLPGANILLKKYEGTCTPEINITWEMWSYMHFENQLMIQSSSDYKH